MPRTTNKEAPYCVNAQNFPVSVFSKNHSIFFANLYCSKVDNMNKHENIIIIKIREKTNKH